MSYLKRLTLMGKVTDSAQPQVHHFQNGNLNVDAFLKTVKPAAVRRVLRTQAGDRIVSIYQLVPPGTKLPDQSSLLKSENVILSLSSIRRLQGRLELAVDYAHHGGEIFGELLAALDMLARYSHGNFANAVIRFAYQWVFLDVMGGGANWTLEDDRLGDAIFQYITATTAADTEYRRTQLSNYLKSERAGNVIRPLADSIMESFAKCREELHAVPDMLSERFVLTLKALNWATGEKETLTHEFKSYQPFGEWKASREQFHQAFREFKDNRARVDNFIRNVPEHAYVMLFLFSKYGALGNNPADNQTLAAKILSIAIQQQKHRCFGLPAGVTRYDLSEIIRKAYYAANQMGMNADQLLRWTSLLPELITSAEEVTSPQEKLDKGVFLAGAVADFSQTVTRVFKDSVLALIRGAEQRQKALCNQARRIAALPKSRAEQVHEFQSKLAEWEPAKEKPNKEDNFMQAIKRNLVAAVAVWKADSTKNLYLDVVQALSDAVAIQAQENLRDDKEGTTKFVAAVKRYSLQLCTRIDSQYAETLGHGGTSTTLDVSCQTNEEHKARQDQTEPSARLQRIRERRKNERRGEAASCKLAGRSTKVAAKTARAIPERHSSSQDVVGGRLKIQTTAGHEMQLFAEPAEVPLQTPAEHSKLSDSGFIVRKQDGARVGSYSRNPATKVMTTSYAHGISSQRDDLLVSGTVSVAPETQIQFTNVTFTLTGNDLLTIGKQADDSIQVAFDAKHDCALQVFEFARAEDRICRLHKENVVVPIEIRSERPDDKTVSLQVQKDSFGLEDRFEFKYSLEMEFEQIVPRDEFSLSGKDLVEIGDQSDAGVSLALVATDERARQILEFAQLPEAERTCVLTIFNSAQLPVVVPVKFAAGQPVQLQISRSAFKSEDRFVFRRNLAKSFPTPDEVIVEDLSNEQLGDLTTDLLDDISALANEYTQPENPSDNWHCAVRSRRFREEVLACPPGTVPFGLVDLGVSFEAIARLIRHVGNRALPDLFNPEPSQHLTSLPDLDLSACFPVNTTEDVVNVITQYIIACKEDQALLPYRQELNEVLVAVEQLGRSHEREFTFVDSTLKDYVSTLPPNAFQPARAFFATHPTCFLYVLRCGLANKESLDRLGVAFDRLTDPNGVAQFRYPLVTTANDLDYSKWWFVSLRAILANIAIDPDNNVDLLALRKGVGNFSRPLACILGLILEQRGQQASSFDIGSDSADKWTDWAVWNDTDTLGTAILKVVSKEWSDAQPGQEASHGLWPILARQRVNNMSFARHRIHNNVPGFLNDIQKDFKDAMVQVEFIEGVGSLPLVPPVHTGPDHERRLLIVENAANNQSLMDAASAPCPVGAALKFKRG
jgi:hypothetical protein